MKKMFLMKLKEFLLKSGAKFFEDDGEFIEKNDRFSDVNEFKDMKNIIKNGVKKDTIYLSDLTNELKSKIDKAIEILKSDEDSMKVFKILKSISSESYIIGGANRNALAGYKIKDYDFVTDANLSLIEKEFKNHGYKIDLIGKHFAVIMVCRGGGCWEIANFRKDLECNGEGATKVAIGTFDDDWQRRDFRFNAIYSDPFSYILIDPTKYGIQDAINREINFIGDPDKRIDEDAIRLLRILKFYKEGFKISNKTMTAFRRNFYKICKANPERIREHIEYITFFEERKSNDSSNER